MISPDSDIIIYSSSKTCGLYYHELYHALYGNLSYESYLNASYYAPEELAADDYAASLVGAEQLALELEELIPYYTGITLTELKLRIWRLK
jgi:hypothetical protein